MLQLNLRHSIFAAATALAVFLPAPMPGASRHRSYSDLATDSDKVVIGTVGVRSSYWGEDSKIYTEVVVSPDVTIKGDENGPVTVQVLGGTVGDVTMAVSDGPELQEGQRMVLFLRRDRGHYAVTGRAAGTVSADSDDANDAVEGAFQSVEGRSGRKLGNKRALASGYLRRTDGATARQQATTQAAATAVQNGCYSTDGGKWNAASATYKIGATVPSTWTASIQASAATWNAVQAGFALVNDQNSVNELSAADLVSKYGTSYDNTYAVTTTWFSSTTGVISKATIEINSKWQWSVAGEANMADVQNILTHEFGHWMRLLDIYSPSSCSEVTMFGTAALGETKKRTLDQADIDGFRSLYSGSTNTTLAAPVLASPANGATNVPTSTNLTWSAVSGATSYDVYFGSSTSPALVGTVTGTSYPVSGLTAGTAYSWRVVAKGSGSATATSGTWLFTTAASTTNGTLAAPTLVTPGNGATGVSLTPVLRWTAVSGATSYDLYIGTTANPPKIGTVSATAVTVSGFRSGVTYYWKVVARSATASGTPSAVWSFRTQ